MSSPLKNSIVVAAAALAVLVWPVPAPAHAEDDDDSHRGDIPWDDALNARLCPKKMVLDTDATRDPPSITTYVCDLPPRRGDLQCTVELTEPWQKCCEECVETTRSVPALYNGARTLLEVPSGCVCKQFKKHQS